LRVRRGKPTVSSALKELGEELEYHNRIVQQQYQTFNAISGFSAQGTNNGAPSEDNQFREMWINLMLKQQENNQKQAENQVQFLQQLILGKSLAVMPITSEHVCSLSLEFC